MGSFVPQGSFSWGFCPREDVADPGGFTESPQIDECRGLCRSGRGACPPPGHSQDDLHRYHPLHHCLETAPSSTSSQRSTALSRVPSEILKMQVRPSPVSTTNTNRRQPLAYRVEADLPSRALLPSRGPGRYLNHPRRSPRGRDAGLGLGCAHGLANGTVRRNARRSVLQWPRHC